MAKPRDISPRKDFSPIRVRLENPGRRPRPVQLFRTLSVPKAEDATIKLLHPDMHYGVVCSMLERVTLVVGRTQLQVVKGDAEAYQAESMVLATPDKNDLVIPFNNTPRYSEEPVQFSDLSFRIGPGRQLSMKIYPGTVIELCFFISSGLVPSGRGRAAMENAEA